MNDEIRRGHSKHARQRSAFTRRYFPFRNPEVWISIFFDFGPEGVCEEAPKIGTSLAPYQRIGSKSARDRLMARNQPAAAKRFFPNRVRIGAELAPNRLQKAPQVFKGNFLQNGFRASFFRFEGLTMLEVWGGQRKAKNRAKNAVKTENVPPKCFAESFRQFSIEGAQTVKCKP